MEKFLELLWNVLNSPAVITALAGLLLYGLNKLYDKKPGWSQYEGTIISAVRYAEKVIPDSSESKSLAKLDKALKYVLEVYESKEGKPASDKVKSELREGIQIIHTELEASGALGKK